MIDLFGFALVVAIGTGLDVAAVEKGGGRSDSNRLLCAQASVLSRGEFGEGIGSSSSSAFIPAPTCICGSTSFRTAAVVVTAL